MADPNRPPLWREMFDAYDTAPPAPAEADDDWTDRHGYAAEIIAVRDWLASQLPEVGAEVIRTLLTAEADRAEHP